MDSSTRESLEAEFLRRVENLNNLGQGTEEFTKEVEGINKLGQLLISNKKVDNEHEEKEDEMLTDERKLTLEHKHFRITNIAQWVVRGLEFSLSLTTLIVYISLYKSSMKFEETGAFVSRTFTGLRNSLKLGKKID